MMRSRGPPPWRAGGASISLDVRKWLEAGGFGRYAELFESNEIDGEALRALTDQHLKELGIALGPRAKLLKAIAQLENAADLEPQRRGSTIGREGQAASAERRQLTVMFVDLVGSTALSSQLDPEDLRKVIRGYQAAVAAQVARYDGHIAQYLGDGVLAYFGYPTAHEDEPERAVRAGLLIVDEVGRASGVDGETLAARVGIATGLTVVGDLVGDGAHKEHAVVGETPNLAARLQGLAAPGQVVLSARTRQLVRQHFELQDLGLQALKGLAKPVPAYAVVGERSAASRFEARSAGELADMVGRDGELGLLRERWRMAAAGEGQLVLITGDAGIGKSRVLRALQDTLAAEPHVRISYQCSPYHTDSALYPLIQQLERAAGIAAGDPIDVKLDRLEALVGDASTTGTEEVALLAALMGIDGAKRYGPLRLTPQQQRSRTFEALIQQPLRLARAQPVLIALEDAHWIDPTTLELFELSVERLGAARILIAITARPSFQHSFGERRDVTQLSLTRLGRAHIVEVASRVARGKALPEELANLIAAKTDGVPLFVEELTKTLLESGRLREAGDAFVVDGALDTLEVPASLHDSLVARLDRLQAGKEVAQTAACIGREFDYRLLAAISPVGESALQEALARLAESEIVFRRGTPPEARYSFKHALLRDAAYECLLKAKRQEIHARLVGALEARPDAAPELLAHHAAQAALAEKAIAYWHKAAMQAIARPAYQEAVSHLEHGIRLAADMGTSRAWQERRLLLLLTLGQTSIPLRGYGHPKTMEAFAHAQQLADAMGDAPHRFSISYALWSAQYIRGEQDQALATARAMLEGARADGHPGHRVSALRSLAISQMISGAPLAARESFAQAAELATALRSRSREQRVAAAQRFAADPDIATQFHVGLTHWALGETGLGERLVAEALAAARGMGHVHTLGHALAHAAIYAVVSRNAERASALASETMDFTRRHELEMFRAYGVILHAYAAALQGDYAASAAAMETGLGYMARTHTRTMVPIHHAVQACSLARLGRSEEAERHAALVREELRSGSERYFWPECQRLLGDYIGLSQQAAVSDRETAYARALALAREQGATSWARYAEESLAALREETT